MYVYYMCLVYLVLLLSVSNDERHDGGCDPGDCVARGRNITVVIY